MDTISLRQLSSQGLAAGAAHIAELASWSWDESENTGDARFCSIARMLSFIAAEWDHRGYLDPTLVEEIDGLLASHLLSVLDEPDPKTACHVARSLREEVGRALALSS